MSFAPFELRAYNRIDMKCSPVFKLINLMERRKFFLNVLSQRAQDEVISYGIESCAKLLKANRASVHDIDYTTGKTILHYAARCRVNYRFISRLIDFGASKELRAFNGRYDASVQLLRDDRN